MKIRKFDPADLDDVMEIENAAFAAPWRREHFLSEFDKTIAFSWVGEIGDEVIAYIIAWVVEDELHIANLAVRKEWRRQGIGEALVIHLLAHAAGCNWAGLEVRRSNKAARTLYSKLGFYEIGVRNRYYADQEDAILMEKVLSHDME